jgi:hypothetical protein
MLLSIAPMGNKVPSRHLAVVEFFCIFLFQLFCHRYYQLAAWLTMLGGWMIYLFVCYRV